MAKASMAEQRFIKMVLDEETEEIVREHREQIRRLLNQHTGQTASTINYSVQQSGAGAKATVHHLARQRFLDMKTRNTKAGKMRKTAFPIHNKILYGHQNSIIARIKFGFTDSVKQTLQQIEE